MPVRFVAVFLFFIAVRPTVSIYETYYVAEKCSSDSTEVFYELGSTMDSSSAIILKSSSTPLSSTKNCTIVLQPNGFIMGGVTISLPQFNLRKTNRGCVDYLKIYGKSWPSPETLCGYRSSFSSEPTRTYENSPTLRIGYYIDNAPMSWSNVFEIVATGYSDDRICSSYEFRCKNSKCIWNGLKCDGYDNCGDNSDEEKDGVCGKKDSHSKDNDSSAPKTPYIAVPVVLVVLLIAGTVTRKLRQKQEPTTVEVIPEHHREIEPVPLPPTTNRPPPTNRPTENEGTSTIVISEVLVVITESSNPLDDNERSSAPEFPPPPPPYEAPSAPSYAQQPAYNPHRY